jgi:hypothetical protein
MRSRFLIPDSRFLSAQIVWGEVWGVNVRTLGTDLSLWAKTQDSVRGYMDMNEMAS